MPNVLSPSFALESSICNYLTVAAGTSGSALSGSAFTAYTGIGNTDKMTVPAVTVDASDIREVVPFSRCYEFNTKIDVAEMAADTVTLGTLANAIFNEFVDSKTASGNISNANYNIAVWQVQTMGMTPGFREDALTHTIELRIVGALVPHT